MAGTVAPKSKRSTAQTKITAADAPMSQAVDAGVGTPTTEQPQQKKLVRKRKAATVQAGAAPCKVSKGGAVVKMLSEQTSLQ